MLLIGFGLSVPAAAQSFVADGDQVQLNTVTTGEQVSPRAACDSEGAHVVVWQSESSPDTDNSGTSILARSFGADGKPVAPEFQVNAYILGYQILPSIAMRSTGQFVVVWGSDSSVGTDSFYSIEARLFSADAIPLGDEFQVNTVENNIQEFPAVAMAGDGKFLIVWQSVGSPEDDSDGRSIQGQLFSADGSSSGTQFQVNTYTTGDQADPEVVALPGGDFVVTWFNVSGSAGNDDSGRSVQGQVVSAAGLLLGGEFQVNTYTEGHQSNSAIAVDGAGNFIIAWTSEGSSGSDDGYCILAQRYDADALAISAEFQVNDYTTGIQAMSSVAAWENGDFLLSWRSGEYDGGGPDGDSWGIATRLFSSDGNPVDGEFVANNETTGRQSQPDVLRLNHGARIVWQSESSSGGDGDQSIQGRGFVLSIFSDDFETGDSDRWEVVVPGGQKGFVSGILPGWDPEFPGRMERYNR